MKFSFVKVSSNQIAAKGREAVTMQVACRIRVVVRCAHANAAASHWRGTLRHFASAATGSMC